MPNIRTFGVLASAALSSTALAQSVTPIPAMTVPSFSTIDMDNIGTGPGPVTTGAVAAAGLPSPAAISSITFTANGGPSGVYNTNPQGLGLALGPGGMGMELISDAGGAFNAADLQIDLLVPATEFGLNIGDWVSTATLDFYGSGTLLASITTAPFATGTANQFFQMTGGTFDRVDVIAGGNWVITELVIEGSAVGFAQANPYGGGCGGVSDYASYYEQFASGTFDLGGAPGSETVLNHLNAGTGYVVVAGAPAWFTPISGDLGLGDDQVSPAQSLGFAMTFPGGGPTVTDIYISSNGFIWLANNTNSDLFPSATQLVSQDPRIAMFWQDLRPAAGGGTGTIHFDSDPANGVAYVTFVGVEGFANPSALVDVQCALFANGSFELRYGAETMSASGTRAPLVGYSPGMGSLVPPASDLSSPPVYTAPDLVVPDLSLSSDRPVEGSNMNITIDNIPAGTVLGTLVLSGTQFDPGIQPLPGLGLCVQHVGLDDVFYFLPTGSTHVVTFPVPATGFTGAQVFVQAVTLSPGVNSVGVASSNGIAWTVDAN